MLRERQRQTGLAHRWTRRNYNEILFLKARSQRIQPAKASGHAGHYQVAVLHGLRLFQNAFGRMLDMFEALPNPLIRQGKDRVLGVIENVLRLVLFFQSFRSDFIRDLNELPQQRFSAHHFRVLRDAGDMRQAVSQIG